MINLLREKGFIQIFLIIFLVLIIYNPSPQRIRVLNNVRLKTQDILAGIIYGVRGPAPAAEKMIVVSIDEESMTILNKRWPWPRDIFASLIRILKGYSPAMIAIDLSFIGESPDKTTDEALAGAMRDAGNVVIASHFSKDGMYTLPDRLIRESAASFGFVNKPRDTDYIVRRARPVMLSVRGNIIDYSFGLKCAASYLKVKESDISYNPVKQYVRLRSASGGDHLVPVNWDRSIDLNFQARESDLSVIPFWRIISGEVDPQVFKDKMVFVGTTAELFHDTYGTPFGIMPGVFINVNESLMYLSGRYAKRINDLVIFLVQFILAIGILLVIQRYGLAKGLLAAAALTTAALFTTLFLMLQGVIFDFFGVGFILAFTYIVSYSYKNVGLLLANMILRREATIDALTGLYIYRFFEVKINDDFQRALQSQSQDLSLILIDIDRFKEINDKYGHEDGNTVMRELAKIVTRSRRITDTTCRYGGDEFCIIMPYAGPDGAVKYAEKIRSAVESHVFMTNSGPLHVTVSIGAALIGKSSRSPKDLIRRADLALYRAKTEGKNRVVFLEEER